MCQPRPGDYQRNTTTPRTLVQELRRQQLQRLAKALEKDGYRVAAAALRGVAGWLQRPPDEPEPYDPRTGVPL